MYTTMIKRESELPMLNSVEKSSISYYKVWLKEIFKPRYRRRTIYNKGAILILVWSFLATNLVYFIRYAATTTYSSLVYYIALSIGVLLIPVAGWLADVSYGRYKIVQWSMWTMWIGSMLLAGGLVIIQLLELQNGPYLKLVLIFLIPLGIGCGGFQANVIQFGVDQLVDASSDEVKVFIIWYVWTYISGQVTASLTLYYVSIDRYKLLSLSLLVCANLSVAMSTNLLCRNVLIREPSARNTFKMVHKVITYAVKNKQPRQRSAFTYWEDKIPSRIDLGKKKYGGPFTTEQVEDVKTLFRVLFIVLVVAALLGTTDEQYESTKIYFQNMLRFDDSHLSSYVYYNFYFIAGTVLIPLNEILIYPLFSRCLPGFNSYWKCIIGVLLYFFRYLILVALLTYTRQDLNVHLSNNSTVTVVPCIFYDSHSGPLNRTLDSRWIFLLEFLSISSVLFFYIGSIEFYCAQIPYTMKGLVVGIFYGLSGIFVLVSQSLSLPFKARSLAWGNDTLSCGFWYLITRMTCTVIMIVIAAVVMRCYKTRKREDILPNEHVFAEAYYSRDT